MKVRMKYDIHIVKYQLSKTLLRCKNKNGRFILPQSAFCFTVLEIDSDVYRLRLYMNKKSYVDAQAECQSLGGFVIFNTEARQKEINNDINEASKKLQFYEQSLLKRTSFWIGGKCLRSLAGC